ncbi:ferritin [Prochlorococcus sp. MIT 1307]|uniref:ferritin n=1 Tax=Prochlorococcus sp. MIT 1307 TaxID=3096219 RepID=UPI002A74D731|nr:ferritin [Prochlorococcus sp. MIT 1307]
MTVTPSNSLKIKTGPAGRAMAEAMQSELVEGLLQHLTMERSASAQYFANSLWFAERELKGFSSFFKKESENEQAHASIFADYLIARGQSVLLEKLKAPIQSWSDIEEVFAASFQMEADVTTSLHQLYAIAERDSDVRTNVFLDPIIEGQTSSEDEFAHLLGRVRFTKNQPSALLIIDGELNI